MRAAALAVVLTLAGCGPGPGEVHVYSAASLRDAMTEAASAYESSFGVDVVLAIGASNMLAAQIEHGAPADVLLSADAAPLERLAAAGMAGGDPVAVARNRLVVVIGPGGARTVRSWVDLARPGVRVVAADRDVPLRRYADAALAALTDRPDAPDDFARRVAANIVSREGNARAVLAKVQLGEADAAIVYATDARAAPELATLSLPDGAAVTTTYLGVVVAGGGEAAARFLAWLGGPDGQRILARHGFAPA